MPRTTRSKNLELLVHIVGRQKDLAVEMSAFGMNQTDISNMTMGKKRISDAMARNIEDTLRLADGWMDRDNMSLTSLSADDFTLVTKLLAAKPRLKAAIGSLLDAV